jgi:type II secretory pathway component PulF
MISSVRAGEESGNLENSLTKVAEQINRDRELVSKIRSAMAYPIIVITLSLVVGLGIAFVILPKITPIFKGLKIDLPITTRALIAFSGFIDKNGFLFFFLILFFFLFSFWILRKKFIKPFSHLLILNIPIIGKIIKFKNLSQFSSLLSLLIKSGISFNESLGICSRTAKNYYYKNILDEARKKVAQGEKLSEYLLNYSNYFPEIAVSMIRVGERSGSLEEELFNISKIYEKEADNMIKVLSAMIEPILLIVIGLFVGILAVSVISPIYKITGNIYG